MGASRPRRNPAPVRPNNDYYRAKRLQEERRAFTKQKNIPKATPTKTIDADETNHSGSTDGADRGTPTPSSNAPTEKKSVDEVIDEVNKSLRDGTPIDINHLVEDDDLESAFFAGIANTGPSPHSTPNSLTEALNGPEAGKWRAALNDELHSLIENDVYDVVPTPKGIKPITSKAVLRIKLDSNGNIDHYKLQIVTQGFTQKHGVDYKEVFAPVANLESIRIILALAAKYDLELDQMDVATAYLNGELEEELYMHPPEGVAVPKGHCWKLKRSLYGLKQAGRTWNLTLDKKLRGMGAIRLNAETCLYVFKERDKICFLVVYVDDFLLASNSRPYMDSIKAKLSSAFKMKDLGPASYILGIAISRDRLKRTISLSQAQYIKTVVERCGMADSKPAWTPMETRPNLSMDDPNGDNTPIFEMDINGRNVSYSSIVGSLMYATMGTRPDLAFVVGALGRFSSSPKRHHWAMAKHALRYLKSTADMTLCFDGNDISGDMDFKPNTNFDFKGYSDADWNGDPDGSKSTSGFVFLSTRGAIGWSSKLQKLVALSSTESEYIGLCNAGQHLAWLRSFFEDIGYGTEKPTDLFCDNQAAIVLTKDAQFRARTKHISRKYHYLRDDIVGKGLANVIFVPTDDNAADIFTKPLPFDKHWKFTRAMGLQLRTSGSVENQ